MKDTPTRRGGGAPLGATPKQRRYIRRLLGGYVRGVAWRHGSPVFARPEDAVCYALSRAALTRGSRVGTPRSAREAHGWIDALKAAAAAGYARTDEGLAVVALARRREHADWRRMALAPLAARYGYPRPGWLGRLNVRIAAARDDLPGPGAGHGCGHGKSVDADPVVFRTAVVDPLFRAPLAPPAARVPGHRFPSSQTTEHAITEPVSARRATDPRPAQPADPSAAPSDGASWRAGR